MTPPTGDASVTPAGVAVTVTAMEVAGEDGVAEPLAMTVPDEDFTVTTHLVSVCPLSRQVAVVVRKRSTTMGLGLNVTDGGIGAAGVTAFESPDGFDVPTEFVAVTVNT